MTFEEVKKIYFTQQINRYLFQRRTVLYKTGHPTVPWNGPITHKNGEATKARGAAKVENALEEGFKYRVECVKPASWKGAPQWPVYYHQWQNDKGQLEEGEETYKFLGRNNLSQKVTEDAIAKVHLRLPLRCTCDCHCGALAIATAVHVRSPLRCTCDLHCGARAIVTAVHVRLPLRFTCDCHWQIARAVERNQQRINKTKAARLLAMGAEVSGSSDMQDDEATPKGGKNGLPGGKATPGGSRKNPMKCDSSEESAEQKVSEQKEGEGKKPKEQVREDESQHSSIGEGQSAGLPRLKKFYGDFLDSDIELWPNHLVNSFATQLQCEIARANDCIRMCAQLVYNEDKESVAVAMDAIGKVFGVLASQEKMVRDTHPKGKSYTFTLPPDDLEAMWCLEDGCMNVLEVLEVQEKKVQATIEEVRC